MNLIPCLGTCSAGPVESTTGRTWNLDVQHAPDLLGRSRDRVGRLGAVAAPVGSSPSRRRRSGATPGFVVAVWRRSIESQVGLTAGSLLGEVIGEEDTRNSLDGALVPATLVLAGIRRDKGLRSLRAKGADTCAVDARVVGSVKGSMHVRHLNILFVSGIGPRLLSDVSLSGILNTSTGGSAAANLVDVASELVLEGEEMVTPDAAPPGRLVDDAELAVDGLTALMPLTNEFLVLVGTGEAVEELDVEDEEGREVSPAEDDGDVSVKLDEGKLELPSDEGLIGNGGEGEGDDEPEAQGHSAGEANGAIEDATVTGLVVLDRVAQRVDDGEPRDKEEEGGDLEANIGGTGDGFVLDLFGGALKLSELPATRDNHEEVLATG